MKFPKIKRLRRKIADIYLKRYWKRYDEQIEKAKKHGPGYWIVINNLPLGVWDGKEIMQIGYYEIPQNKTS